MWFWNALWFENIKGIFRITDGHPLTFSMCHVSHFSLSSIPLLSCSTYSLTVTDLGFHIISMPPAYLPGPSEDYQRRGQDLKEASTAPMAMASAGSVEGGKQRRRSSKHQPVETWPPLPHERSDAAGTWYNRRNTAERDREERHAHTYIHHTFMRPEGRLMTDLQCEKKRWQAKRGEKKQGKGKQKEELVQVLVQMKSW